MVIAADLHILGLVYTQQHVNLGLAMSGGWRFGTSALSALRDASLQSTRSSIKPPVRPQDPLAASFPLTTTISSLEFSVSASLGLKPQLQHVYVYGSPPVIFAHNIYLHYHSSSLSTLAFTQSSSPTLSVMVVQRCSTFTTIHHHLSIHGQTTCPPHPTTLA